MNSALVSYTFTDHNKRNARKNKTYNASGKVLKITPHHQAGNLTMDQIKNEILKPSRQFSCNYAIERPDRRVLAHFRQGHEPPRRPLR